VHDDVEAAHELRSFLDELRDLAGFAYVRGYAVGPAEGRELLRSAFDVVLVAPVDRDDRPLLKKSFGDGAPEAPRRGRYENPVTLETEGRGLHHRATL